jgi:SAM-dependent methyltransferase
MIERSEAPNLPTRPIEAGWLALREPADTRARDAASDLLLPPLLAQLKHLGDDAAPRVVDLGSGTGANLRWLAPRLPHPERQHWTLVDHDPGLLARGPVHATPLQADVIDLGRILKQTGEVDLVTAAALLDLLDTEELGAIVDAVIEAGAPALFALTVDGFTSLDPMDPDDPPLEAAFDAHQRRGGRLGPDAAAYTAALFRERGRQVVEVPTAWRLDPAVGDAALVGTWLEGRAQAAVEHEPGLRPVADAWLSRRAPDGLGQPKVMVGHVDLLALP